MNHDVASDAVNYWHFEDNMSIRKLDLDLLDRVLAFRPLLARLTPNFYKNVVSNNNIVGLLNEKECSLLQRIIDQILYKDTSLTNMDTDESIILLFLLSQGHGDLIQSKSMIIQSLIRKIGFDNVLDILENVERYLTRFESSSSCPLMKVKEYCLDFMGSQVSEPGYEFFIENDERIDKYLRLIIKRKTIKPVTWEETPNNISKSPLMDLFNDEKTSDICFQVGNEKIHCHKTILISRSVYFETLLQGNWSIELETYGPEMKYLIQYCYGFMSYVPAIHQMPLIKRAHEHEMKDLIPIVSKQILVAKENFDMLWNELEHYSEETIFSEIIERVIKYGFDHELFEKNGRVLKRMKTESKETSSMLEVVCIDSDQEDEKLDVLNDDHQQEDDIISSSPNSPVLDDSDADADSICFDDYSTEEDSNKLSSSGIANAIGGTPAALQSTSELVVEEIIDITSEDSQNSRKDGEKVCEEDEEDNISSTSSEDSDDFLLLSDEEEDYYPSKTTKRVHKLLSELIPSGRGGSFSVGGEFDTYPAIGLQLLVPNNNSSLANVERRNISFPFESIEQANDIIQLARMEDNTKPWILETNQFEITNPHWNDMIINLVNKEVKRGLEVGKSREVLVQLSKLLLFEGERQYDFLLDHKKEENMFATLVVFLPSTYSGGEISVKYKSNENIYPYSSKSHFATSYLSFYRESHCKTNPITDGLRLALVYNIIYIGPYYLMPTIDGSERATNYLSKTLAEWESETPFVIHILDKVYSKYELSDAHNLEENDSVLYYWLDDYNSVNNDFYLCLGKIYKVITGDITKMSKSDFEYHERWESKFGRYCITEMDHFNSDNEMENEYATYSIPYLNVDDEILSSDVSVPDISVVIPFLFDDFEKKDYEFVHDEKFLVQGKVRFSRSCIVIIPKKNYVNALEYLDSDCKHKYFSMLVDDQVKNPTRSNLDLILRIAKNNWLVEDDLLKAVLTLKNEELAIEFSNCTLCLKSWQKLVSNLGFMNGTKQQFFKFIVSNLSNKVAFDFSFGTILSQEDSTLTSEFCNYVFQYLSTNGCLFPYAIERILSCMELCAVPLMESTAFYMIQRCAFVDETELVLILKYFERFPTYMVSALTVILRNKKRFFKYYSIIIGYLQYFLTDEIVNSLNNIIMEADLNDSLKLIIYLNGLDGNEAANFILPRLKERVINQLIPDDINVELVKSIISAFCSHNFPSELSLLTSAIISKMKDFKRVTKVLIPLLKFIESKYGRSSFSTLPAFAQLVNCGIEFVKPVLMLQKEADVDDWSLPTFQCEKHCHICQNVNNFLQNHSETSVKLKKTTPILRAHIETNLYSVPELLSSYINLKTKPRSTSLVIQKISNPRAKQYEKRSKTRGVLRFLKDLLSNKTSHHQQSSSSSNTPSSKQDTKRLRTFTLSSNPNKKKK